MLEGLLGGEAEGEEERRRPAALDPFVAAAALAGAAHGAPLDPRLAAYLEAQTKLAQLDAHHFDEERELAIDAAKRRRFSDRLRIAFQLLLALIVSGIAVGFLLMIHDAFTARSVVVDPFEAPPALGLRGLTGQVVAEGLLDRLTQLQSATRGSLAKRNIINAWTSDIKVEVPETGISIGEIDRLLKERFGHDLHIEGDLVQTLTGGLALTVRGTGLLAKTFEGATGDLETLTTQAAEYIYGQSQPSIYLIYLSNNGRDAEAVAFARKTYAIASPEDRPYILNGWANSLANIGGSVTDALALYRQAVALKPDYWIGRNNVMNALWELGREEDVWRTGQAMQRLAGGRPGRAPELLYQNLDYLTWNLAAYRDAQLADAAAHGGVGSSVAANGPVIADIEAKLHDFAAAELTLQTALGDAKDPTVGAMAHFVRGRIASERGDVAGALRELEAFRTAYADPIVSSNYPGYLCWLAPAEEAAGHPDKADAVLAAAGSYVDCYRFRGDILDRRGDWAQALHAYAAAVRLAPDLPAGYYSAGLAYARHGDRPRAERMLAAANARGPNWADPLKAWGDVLLREGDRDQALSKYQAALAKAPAWAELRGRIASVAPR